jgi:pimeloyl-ACP methyl ester carboxylesterase
MASVVAEALEKMGTGPVVVFGVSMGGDVALNLALAAPEHVRALVLIAPGGLVSIFKNRLAQYLAWLTAQSPDWVLLPTARLANRFVKTALRAMVRDVDTIPSAVIDEFAREARHPKAGVGYARYNQAVIGHSGMLNDLSDCVRNIQTPTLFFHGAADGLVDPQGSRRAAQRMPDAVLHIAPDCGHWAQLEQHELFASTVREFLVKRSLAQ